MKMYIFPNKKIASNFFMLILSISTIVSCSSVDGLYSFKGNHGDFSKLNIKKDNRFTLVSYSSPYLDTISGSWNFIADTVYMKPDTMPNYINPKTKVVESFEKNIDSIRIRIILNDSISSLSEIFINNKKSSRLTNDEGILSLSKDTKIDFIVSGSLGYPFYEHKVVDSKSNIFTIYIYDWIDEPRWTYYNFTYKYFKKSNKLFPYDIDSKTNKSYYLKKEH
ncbi:hypothetical protein [Lacinutrix sp. MEBiC02404]